MIPVHSKLLELGLLDRCIARVQQPLQILRVLVQARHVRLVVLLDELDMLLQLENPTVPTDELFFEVGCVSLTTIHDGPEVLGVFVQPTNLCPRPLEFVF